MNKKEITNQDLADLIKQESQKTNQKFTGIDQQFIKIDQKFTRIEQKIETEVGKLAAATLNGFENAQQDRTKIKEKIDKHGVRINNIENRLDNIDFSMKQTDKKLTNIKTTVNSIKIRLDDYVAQEDFDLLAHRVNNIEQTIKLDV
ncbi:hypothetical protein KJ855_03835 [Patescibacteria group bacterium]|nr:hypothetical protein [Patescibacteria group bacterium]